MAKKISLINMKGGVGKSTLTVNLAWHFAAYSNWLKKVLVIDLDPQFNASQYLFGVNRYEQILQTNTPTVWEVFEQNTRTPSGRIVLTDPHDPIFNVRTIRGGGIIDLIPSRLELSFALKNPGQKERQLSKIVTAIEDEYDLIFIDCAPTESILTTAAYLSSDYLLVPVKPEYLSSIGLPLLVNSMQDFNNDYEDHHLELAGVVFNGTSEYSPEELLSKERVREIARQNNWYVFNAEVPYSRSFPKGAREGQPIFRTSYSRWNQVHRFNVFATEFATRIAL
ncbi:MAG: Sporulation initiation inhibitor protein Soj [Syntrophomonadaceae bacterium]|nr:Sporulation initiation inhibitor protein Soj [Bacillota bacterium]MBT9147555.1 Sporulation initiation inhibitor protein Soj [Bacillota bacterium]